MLGEILGRKAGETGIELTLPRFLLPLDRSCGVFLAPTPDPASSCGLWVAGEAVTGGCASEGEGSGASDGVLEVLLSSEGCVGVGQFAVPFRKFADSGSSSISICSVSSTPWLPALAPALRVLGELSFMREAGVAGDANPGRAGWRELGIALI
jgi:hypothetical protein